LCINCLEAEFDVDLIGAPVSIHTTICGVDELDDLRNSGVTHILSILDPGSADPAALTQFPSHSRTRLHFHDEIDGGPGILLPQREHIETIISAGRTLLSEDDNAARHIVIHCQKGISRSTAAMAVLLAVLNPQRAESEIFSRVLELRSKAWPNCRMIELADDLLERQGRLLAGLRRLYATRLGRDPEMGVYLRINGRAREVDMGLACDGPSMSERPSRSAGTT
jgi:predicted protein tyrosine phosphatase